MVERVVFISDSCCAASSLFLRTPLCCLRRAEIGYKEGIILAVCWGGAGGGVV